MSYTADQIESAVMDQYAGWSAAPGPGSLDIDGEKVDYTVVNETGGMDKGSNASVTIKIGDQYFTKEGDYQSHYGYEWDGDCYESLPTEIPIIEFRRLFK